MPSARFAPPVSLLLAAALAVALLSSPSGLCIAGAGACHCDGGACPIEGCDCCSADRRHGSIGADRCIGSSDNEGAAVGPLSSSEIRTGAPGPSKLDDEPTARSAPAATGPAIRPGVPTPPEPPPPRI
jgi:hypothetical protein